MYNMKLPMKLLRIVGLCLTAMFVVSMFAPAGAAAAKPIWEECSSGSPAGTKYTTNQCGTASAAGTFAWQEPATTEKVVIKGSLLLKDTKTTLGESAVECSGESFR